MSDPLTALMHAVQVMNLLKTLITKTLREREESAAGEGYSPLSSHSSDGRTDEEFDSQHEMDTSCELRRPTSDYDDDHHAHYSHSSEHDEDEDEDDDEVQSPNMMIHECFLRQLDKKETARESQEEHGIPASYCGSNMESAASFTDSKNGSSGLSTSDGEDSEASCIVEQKPPRNSSLKGEEEDTDTVEIIDKLVESSDDVKMADKLEMPCDDMKMVEKLSLSN